MFNSRLAQQIGNEVRQQAPAFIAALFCFFKEEDGIRDLIVTGVQTCALPIWSLIVPWIRQVPHNEATGLLRRQLDKAVARSGRVWHIVHVMSVNPPALRDTIQFYLTIMMRSESVV